MEASDEHFFQLIEDLEDQVFYDGDSEIYNQNHQQRKDTGRYEEWTKESQKDIKELQRDLKRSSEKDEREAEKIFNYITGLLDEDTSRRRSQTNSVDELIERNLSNLIGDYTSTEPRTKKSTSSDQQYDNETFYDFIDQDLNLQELQERNDFYDWVDDGPDMSKFKDILDDE